LGSCVWLMGISNPSARRNAALALVVVGLNPSQAVS